MLQQTGQAIEVAVPFIASKVGKTGLTVTVDVYRGTTSLLTAQSATEVGGGIYNYTLASGNTGTAGTYYFVFKTADTTVDRQHIHVAYVVGLAWVSRIDATISGIAAAVWGNVTRTLTNIGSVTVGGMLTLVLDQIASTVWGTPDRVITGGTINTNNDKTGYGLAVSPPTAAAIRAEMDVNSTKLDAAVSSRLAASAYTAPPQVGAIADAVWDEASGDHVAAGSTGARLTAAGATGDPLENPVPGAYLPGTAGAQIARIGSAEVGVSSPVSVTGKVTLYRGKDYAIADGTALTFSSASVLALAIVTLDVSGSSFAGVVSGSAGAWVIRVGLTAAQTTAMAVGVYAYELVATLASGRKAPPLAVGTLQVFAEI
ncbi:MAG: hypothetical protein SGJ24_18290 [Chloroflexota bacterium]|nr:hypothetical protein [Chloroflexota bacterium]